MITIYLCLNEFHSHGNSFLYSSIDSFLGETFNIDFYHNLEEPTLQLSFNLTGTTLVRHNLGNGQWSVEEIFEKTIKENEMLVFFFFF